MILAKVAWAHHSDGSGKRRWHSALGLFACLAGLLLLAAAGHSPALSLLGLTLITVGNGCWIVTFWSLPAALLCGIAAGIDWITSVGNLGGHNSAPILSAVCATSTAAATARSFSCSPASRWRARSSCW